MGNYLANASDSDSDSDSNTPTYTQREQPIVAFLNAASEPVASDRDRMRLGIIVLRQRTDVEVDANQLHCSVELD